MRPAPMGEALRARIAVAALLAGAAGPVSYGLMRGWVYARGGGGTLALLLRQQTVAYFQAIAVSAFVAIALGVALLALSSEGEDLSPLERALLRGVAPAILLAALACCLLP